MKRFVFIISIIALSLSLISCDDNQKSSKGLITAAKYPEMAKYPDQSKSDDEFYEAYDEWMSSLSELNDVPKGYDKSLKKFSRKSVAKILKGNSDKNHVYSPVNLYMALSMLADISDNESRKEVLNLIDTKDIGETREKAKSIWKVLYRNDGLTTSILANSVWLNENLEFKKNELDLLADNYFASSHRGKMGTEEFNNELREWINEQTGGLLKDEASNLKMDAQTLMALASTIYYKDGWDITFDKKDNTKSVFHSGKGDIEVEYMNKNGVGVYYFSDKFSAIRQEFKSKNNMWFILPDEKYSPNDVLDDEKLLDMIFKEYDWEDSKTLIINRKIPKFDVVSDKKISDDLKELGLKNVFDIKLADFSPILSDGDKASLSSVEHAVRVKIDEEGCEAAAYTTLMLDGAVQPPEEEIDFVLDRPFIFAVTGRDGLPVFMGVVNDPVGSK